MDKRNLHSHGVAKCPCPACTTRVATGTMVTVGPACGPEISIFASHDISIRPSYTTWLRLVREHPTRVKQHVVDVNNWLVLHGVMGPSMNPSQLVKWIKRHVCVHCRSFSKDRLQRCPCNQRNFYCNAKCQAADWPVHKNEDMHKQYKRDRKKLKESIQPLFKCKSFVIWGYGMQKKVPL